MDVAELWKYDQIIAVIGLNEEQKKRMEELVEQSYHNTDKKVMVLDISNMSIDVIDSLHNINCIMFHQEILDKEQMDQIQRIQTILHEVNHKDKIKDINVLPIADEVVFRGDQDKQIIQNPDQVITKGKEEALNEKVRNLLYRNLSEEDKKLVYVSPQNFSYKEDFEAYYQVMVKAFLDDLTAQQSDASIGIEQRRTQFLNTFLDAIEQKSPYTRGHLERVASFSEAMAKELKEMAEAEGEKSPWNDTTIEIAKYVAIIHDAGKLATLPEVLNSIKQYGRNSDEMKHLGAHSAEGIAFLNRMIPLVVHLCDEKADISQEDKELLTKASLQGVEGHHSGVEITEDHKNTSESLADFQEAFQNMFAYLVAVPDSADAMLSDRSYNNIKNIVDCLRDLVSNSSPNKFNEQQFHPLMVKAYVRIMAKHLANKGIDLKEMINASRGECYDTRIKDNLEKLAKHDNKLLGYIDDITMDKAPYDVDLGFDMDEHAHAIFENAKKYPFKNNYTLERLAKERQQSLKEDFPYFARKTPEMEYRKEDAEDFERAFNVFCKAREDFGKKVARAGIGIDHALENVIEGTLQVTSTEEINTEKRNLGEDLSRQSIQPAKEKNNTQSR